MKMGRNGRSAGQHEGAQREKEPQVVAHHWSLQRTLTDGRWATTAFIFEMVRSADSGMNE